MLIQKKKLFKTLFLTLPLALVLSCGEEKSDDEDSDATSNDDTATLPGGTSGTGTASQDITLSGTLNLASSLSLAPEDYILYCVTFEAAPKASTASVDSTGAFAVDVWSGVNFGCFVNNATTNLPVAQLEIIGDETPMGRESSTALALSQSVSLGNITLDEEKGVVEVAESVIESSKSTASSQIDLDEIHNQGYVMSCTPSGNADIDAACADLIDGGNSNTVFLRTLKATENGVEVTGMGVWANEASFTACGSFDFGTNEIEGVTFSQGDAGEFTEGADCALRQAYFGSTDSIPENRYAIGKMTPSGLGYSFISHDEYSHENSTCVQYESVKIEFSGTSALMYGLFTMSTGYSSDCTAEETDADRAGVRSFTVTFTQQ